MEMSGLTISCFILPPLSTSLPKEKSRALMMSCSFATLISDCVIYFACLLGNQIFRIRPGATATIESMIIKLVYEATRDMYLYVHIPRCL